MPLVGIRRLFTKLCMLCELYLWLKNFTWLFSKLCNLMDKFYLSMTEFVRVEMVELLVWLVKLCSFVVITVKSGVGSFSLETLLSQGKMMLIMTIRFWA